MIKSATMVALGALLATAVSFNAQAMSHGGKSEAREAFNAALDKCEGMKKDQHEDCMNKAMEDYRMAREKEMMKKK